MQFALMAQTVTYHELMALALSIPQCVGQGNFTVPLPLHTHLTIGVLNLVFPLYTDYIIILLFTFYRIVYTFSYISSIDERHYCAKSSFYQELRFDDRVMMSKISAHLSTVFYSDRFPFSSSIQ